jgi:rhodanese-related sulfurtransferase
MLARKQYAPIPPWLRIVIIAIGVGFAIFLLSTSALFVDNKYQAEVKKESIALKLHNEAMSGQYRLIDTATLKQQLDNKEPMLIVDAMPFEKSYQIEHIPTAVQFLFPISTMVKWNIEETGNKTINDFTALLGSDKSQTLVFYCGFVKCGRSHNAASWAIKLGYTNVYRYPGGIYAWKGNRYSTMSSN